MYRARFLFFGTGYYDYDQPHNPPIPGLEDFGGQVVHPQFWPESLDYAGKKVVVIGSGATAISLVPALAEQAAHVTMLQRSPTYMASMSAVPAFTQGIRNMLPRKMSHQIVRTLNAWVHYLTYVFFRKAPNMGRKVIRDRNKARLPHGYPIDVHFNPRYRPWDQRMCLVLDGDLFEDISAGRVEVVTDHIDHVDPHRHRVEVGRAGGRRHHRHRDGGADAAGTRRDRTQHRRAARRPPPIASSTRSTSSRRCRIWRGVSATPTPRGHYGPT